MIKNITIIAISSVFALGVLTVSNIRTENVMQKYDSCWQVYLDKHIPAEAFNQFMNNCNK